MGHDNLSQQFYSGLYEKENITKEEFIEYDFKCCGIFKPKNTIPRVDEQLIPRYEHLFDKSNKPNKYLSNGLYNKIKYRYTYKRNCICGQTFKNNCFIYSKSYDILLNIGVCCNGQFNKNGIKRFCEGCGLHHKNTKNNFCNECRQNLFSECKKCKSSKKLDKYKWCWTCAKGGENYYNCSICMKPKTSAKDQKFKKCFDCKDFN